MPQMEGQTECQVHLGAMWMAHLTWPTNSNCGVDCCQNTDFLIVSTNINCSCGQQKKI